MRDEGYFCLLTYSYYFIYFIFALPMFGRFKLLICGFFIFVSFQSSAFEAHANRLDSIGIQKVGDRTFIVHQVVRQETLFSISRRYKVPMSEIQEANETLKQGMKEGQTLLVPFGQPNANLDFSVQITPIPATPAASTNAETDATTTTPIASPDSTSSTVVKDEKTTVSLPAEPTSTTASNPAAEVTIQKVESTHKVKSGENLSSIAKKYKVTVAELKAWNSLSSDKVLVGQSLKIISKQAVAVKQSSSDPKAEALVTKVEVKEEIKKAEPKVVEKKAEEPKENKQVVFVDTKESTSITTNTTTVGNWISHTVKSGESLFSLSNQYGTSIEELIQWNALPSNNLKVGQSIKVGQAIAAATTVPVIEEVKSQQTPAPVQPKQEITAPNISGGFTNTKESGLAEVIPGTEASTKYLVLHRNAPVGSIIRVKNEENDLTIFARVVGVLPETGDNSKVLIKLSQAAFKQLKGVNARFPVEILY